MNKKENLLCRIGWHRYSKFLNLGAARPGYNGYVLLCKRCKKAG